MIKRFNSNKARRRRHQRMRQRLEGSQARPRLNIFRSGHHIYAQIIDDTTGQTLAAASSLDESLRDFKPATSTEQPKAVQSEGTLVAVDAAAQGAPAKGKSAKAEKPAAKPQAKGAQPQKGGGPQKGGVAQPKTVLPAAQGRSTRTPVEALVPIANNRKVAIAREVGKLVAQRAKEKDVKQVVFDRGGYAYHGRVASLAGGAREAGLDF